MTAIEYELQTPSGEQVLNTADYISARDSARPLLERKIADVAVLAVLYPEKQDLIIEQQRRLVEFAVLSIKGSDALDIPSIIAGPTLEEQARHYVLGLLDLKKAEVRSGADRTLIDEQNRTIQRQRAENDSLYAQLIAQQNRIRVARGQVASILRAANIENGDAQLAIFDRTIDFIPEVPLASSENVPTKAAVISARNQEAISVDSADVTLSTDEHITFREMAEKAWDTFHESSLYVRTLESVRRWFRKSPKTSSLDQAQISEQVLSQ